MTYVDAAKVSKRCCADVIAALASSTARRLASTSLLCRSGVVSSGLHVDDGLVDALLLGLHRGAELLQLLVGVRYGGDERADGVRTTGLGGGNRAGVGKDGRQQ